MPLSRSRDYLSIGEVLESLRQDFPDVSISKIRFLESEGLISPERTGSGYRKFYEPELARLRYILTLQRDHFLPLKVIKERLAEVDRNGDALEATEPSEGAAPADPNPAPAAASPAAGLTDMSLSRAELLDGAGLSETQLAGLEDFGILPRKNDGAYDGDDLVLAKAARGLFEYGVEPRHLRMFRQTAEREASFVEQIVSPVTKKRDPDAHKEAAASVARLLELSRQMRESLLRSNLRQLL
ncbi:MAG: transcriptional regulator FtsR [Actinomycetota bacterium]